MKKFLLSFLCFLLAIGGGYAEEVTYTVTSTSAVSVSGTAPEGSSATYSSTYSTKCQLTKDNSMTLTLKGFAGNKITGIKMSMKSNKSGGSGYFSAKVGDTPISSIATSQFKSNNWYGSWSQEYVDITPTITETEVKQGENIVIKIAATANSLYCQSFTITYESVEGGNSGSETPAAPSAPTLTASCNFDNAMTVEITNNTTGATVYYTTDDTEPSALNGTEYTAPFEITETTTVKAIAVNEAGVSSNVVEATYTMVDPNAKTGTISFANTSQRVSQTTSQQVWSHEGITLTNNKAKSTSNIVDSSNPVKLYAHSEVVLECSAGNMTQILFDCNNNDDYATALKNSIGDVATVTISGDKVTVILDGTSNRFTISDLTAQVRLDELTVTYTAGATKPVAPILTAGGNFVGFKEIAISCDTEDATIYYTIDESEPTESSEIYDDPFEINTTTTVKAVAVNAVGSSDVVTATYTRVAASPKIEFEGDGTFENFINVTIAAAEGTKVYYTLNDKEDPDKNSDECPKTITLKANATLKVIAYEGEYKSNIVEQKFTLVAESSTGTATLVTNAADLAAGDQVVIVASGYDFALSTDQRDNNRGQVAIAKEGEKVTLNDDVQRLTLEEGTKEGTYAFSTGSGYLYAASSSSNHLKTQTTNNANSSWAITIDGNGVATIKAQGANTRNWLMYNFNSDLFSCYSSGQQGVSLYKVTQIENPVLNVSSVGWATLYLGYNVVIPGDVTCYVASEVGEESVQLTEVEGVLPANTAVIVNAEEGEYTFEVTKETATVESKMKGTTKNEYIDKEAYVLAKLENGKVGFYKASMNGGVFLNNANKAYLPASALPSSVQNAKALKFDFNTTAVENIKVETEGKKVIYDLSGRRVNDMTAPGLYIVNGKKVMVK